MDELYFEEGYLELRYFAVIANASSGSRYFLEGYLPTDYFEYRGSFASVTCDFEVVIIGTTKEFEIAVQLQFDTASAGVKIVSGNALFNSEFTQTGIGVRGQDTDLFAFSDAAIQAQVDRIRDNNIDATAVFSVSSEVSRIRALDTDAFGGFSFVGNVQRSRATEMETQAAFSFAVSEDLFKDFVSDITDSFTKSVQEDLFKAFDAAVNSEITQTADAQRLRDNNITVETISTLTAEFRVVRDAHLTGTGVAAIVCDAVKTSVVSGDLNTAFSLSSNSGFRITTSAGLNTFAGMLVSRYAGSDRPKTIVGSFDSFRLLNSGTRITDFTQLPNYDNWFIEIRAFNSQITSTGFNSIDGGLINIPLGTNNGSAVNWQVSVSKNSQGYNTTMAFIGGGGLGNTITHTVLSTSGGIYAISFTGGQRISLYFNRTRVATISDWNTTDWRIDTTSLVEFAKFYPFTHNTFYTQEANTDWAFASYGDFTQGGSSPYQEVQRINTENTIFLYEFNGNGNETLGITFTSDAAIQANLSSTVAANSTQTITKELTTEFAVTATIGKLEEINLVAFSDGAMIADATKTTENDLVAEIQTSQNTDAQRLRDNDSQQSAEFAVNADNERLRDNDSQSNIAFELLSQSAKTADTGSTFESTTSVTALGGRLEEINLLAFSDGRIEISVRKFTGYTSDISSEATVNAVIGNKKPLAGDLQAEASTATTVDRLRDNDIDNDINASVSLDADRLRDVTASVSIQSKTVNTYIEEEHGLYIDDGYFTEFEIIAQKITDITQNLAVECEISAEIGGSFFAELVANTNADITATAVKQVSALVDKAAEFALAGIASPIRDFDSDISSEFAVFANGVTGGEINAVLFNTAALTATAEATKPFDSSFSSEFTQNAETFDSLNGSLESYQDSEFSQTVEFYVIRDAVIETESIATNLTVAVKETAADIVCETRFDIIIDGAKVTDTTSNNDAAFAISNTAVKTADGVADITTEATANVDAVVVISAVISTESIASQLSAVARVAAFFVNADVISTVSANVSVVRSAVSDNQIIAETNIDGGAVRNAESDVNVAATVNVLAGVVKPFEASIQSAMAFVAGVREIRTDDIVYVIPGEGWTYTITGEGREYDIIGETRMRRITAESRSRTINGESRIYNIE